MLAADTKTSEIVRGQALYEIGELQQWMKAKLSGSAPRQKANMLFALAQIDEFKASPNKFETPASVDMPPGAPIGMPAMDFLNADASGHVCSFSEM
jgi:hypothetical protein